jgi:hypothetical protein
MNFKRLVPVICIGGLIAGSATATRSWSLQAGQTPDPSSANRVLQGTIDIHVHSAPDNVPRLDSVSLADGSVLVFGRDCLRRRLEETPTAAARNRP